MLRMQQIATVIILSGAMAFAGASIAGAQGTGTPSTAGSGTVAKTPASPAGNAMTANPNKPGATGTTVVPGNNSTMAKDNAASVKQKTGAGGGGK